MLQQLSSRSSKQAALTLAVPFGMNRCALRDSRMASVFTDSTS